MYALHGHSHVDVEAMYECMCTYVCMYELRSESLLTVVVVVVIVDAVPVPAAAVNLFLLLMLWREWVGGG